MIKGITITNFKGIGEPIHLDLRPVTMLFGSNSAGKSTIFHSLLYAYEVLVNKNLDADRTFLGADSVDLGGFATFVHRHELGRDVSIEFDLDISSKSLDDEHPITEMLVGGKHEFDVSTIGDDVWSAKIKFTISWNPYSNRPYASEYAVSLNDEDLGKIVYDGREKSTPELADVNLYHSLFNYRTSEDWHFAGSIGIADQLYPWLWSLPEQLYFSEAEEFVTDVNLQYEDAAVSEAILVRVNELAPNEFIEPKTLRRTHDDGREFELILHRTTEGISLWCLRFPFEHGWLNDNAGDKTLAQSIAKEWREILDNAEKPTVRIHDQSDALPDWEQPIELNLLLDSRTEVERDEEDDDIYEQVFRDMIHRLFVVPGRLLANELERCRYIGPLREIPSRGHRPPLSPDRSRWSTGIAAWDSLCNCSEEFLSATSNWLGDKDRLGTGYSIERTRFKELESDGFIMRAFSEEETSLDDIAIAVEAFSALPEKSRLEFLDERSHVLVEAKDIAIGITQLVPIIVAALDDHGGISLMEQPELHNHPSVEVGLGDLFVSTIKPDGRCRHILETHGEHLILRMLRRIRETTEEELPDGVDGLLPEEVAVYFIERGADGVKASRLRIDESGEFIDKWPGGFFRERAEELF